jgi:hypothetical protein
MSEDKNNEQVSSEFRELLKKVENMSEKNFSHVKVRLFNFYYDDVRNNLISSGNVSEESTRDKVRENFEPDPGDLKIEDLRLVKAFYPFAIEKPENIPDWVPDEIRQEILEELQGNRNSDRYFAYNVILGLVQLLRDEGLVSSRHPDSPVRELGGHNREQFEEILNGLGGKAVFPTYAVVEKQENDAGYIQQVAEYGHVWNRHDLGILAVINLKGNLARRSIFSIGDSTLLLTENERRHWSNEVIKTESWKILEELYEGGNLDPDKKTVLEAEISTTLFPEGNYTVKSSYWQGIFNFSFTPADITIINNILGSSVLLPAYELNDKMRKWGLLHTKLDFIEAQILGPLFSENCEGILINEWVLPYLNRVLSTMPEIKIRYDMLKSRGIIREHQEPYIDTQHE